MKLIYDNLTNFAGPVALPVFVDGERKGMDVWADGCTRGEQFYNGFNNKVEVTPLVRVGLGFLPIGESYTIGEGHLTRLILKGARL